MCACLPRVRRARPIRKARLPPLPRGRRSARRYHAVRLVEAWLTTSGKLSRFLLPTKNRHPSCDLPGRAFTSDWDRCSQRLHHRLWRSGSAFGIRSTKAARNQNSSKDLFDRPRRVLDGLTFADSCSFDSFHHVGPFAWVMRDVRQTSCRFRGKICEIEKHWWPVVACGGFQ